MRGTAGGSAAEAPGAVAGKRGLAVPGVRQPLGLLCFCLCANSKMRLPLSLFAPFQKGLKNVFDEAILAALEPPEPKKTRRCVLL